MTYRERFAATLAHQEVDRPPMDLASTDMTEIEGGPRVLAAALGLAADRPPEALDEAVLCALDTDIRGVGGILTPADSLARRVSETEIIDAWGIGYQWSGHHYEATSRPLAGASLADLERYPWPDPARIDPTVIEQCRRRAQFLHDCTPFVVCGRHPYFGVLELGCWMCGYDDFLFRLAGDPEFVQRFFELIWTYQQRVNEVYYGALGRYLHFTTSGDDFGTQTGPFMSPAMFGELIAPYLKRRIQHIRSFTEARFFHHTCGAVHSLIPDLIACGVEILNPIQPCAAGMEPWRLKRDFGAALTFYGGLDTQELLRRGTPEAVGDATRAMIGTLGARGGYILSAAHTIMADVPQANVLAMYRANCG
jgi:uroporphyrinogen decarboxylase